MKRRKFKIVKVTWDDACDAPGWISLEDSMQGLVAESLPDPLECISVGVLVKQNKRAVWLSNTVALGLDGHRGSGVSLIPRPFVKNIKVIGEI